MQGEVLRLGKLELPMDLELPDRPCGIVLLADTDRDSRVGLRDPFFADVLHAHHLGTLLIELFEQEDTGDCQEAVDIGRIGARVAAALDWVAQRSDLARLGAGLFGASGGAAAVLRAAACRPGRVGAVVARGGRPDLAGTSLALVLAPTLLLVGGRDTEHLPFNRDAMRSMTCRKRLEIVPDATHRFDEPGTLDAAAHLAGAWFAAHLGNEHAC